MSSRWIRSSSSRSPAALDDLGLARRRELVADRLQLVLDDGRAPARASAGCRGSRGSRRRACSAPRRSRRGRARSAAAGADRGWRAPARRRAGRCRPPAIRWRGSSISAISGATSFAGQSRAISSSRALFGSLALADDADHLVDIGDGDGEADQDVGAVARLVEQELGAPADHLLAEGDEGD